MKHKKILTYSLVLALSNKYLEAIIQCLELKLFNRICETRLKISVINRLEDRRVRGNLIEMYKSVNGLDESNCVRNPVVNTPKVGAITESNVVKIRRDTFKSRI